MKKSILLVVGLVLTFAVGAFLGSLTGSPATALVAGLLFAGLSFYRTFLPAVHGVALESIDITALAAALGAYHREHRDDLASELLLDENFTADMEVMDDVTDEVPLPELSLTDILQPGINPDFQPKSNAIKFGARILKVRDCKVDLLLEPKVLEKTWLGKLKKASDPTDLPFEKFLMAYINSKITENLRLGAVYKGIYNAAGNTPADTMNGWLKIIVDEITADKIEPVITGAITSANVVDKLEMVYDNLGDAYKNKPTIMKVAPTIYTWYNRKFRSDFGANQDYKGMQRLARPLDGTLCTLVSEPGMTGSQRVIASLPENFVYGTDSASGYNFDAQKFDRQIKLLIDLKAGVQFKQIHSRGLAVNDQA
jgi:hypothetical protein